MITALRPPVRNQLRVSPYDRVSSALMATLVIVTFGVMLMFGIWLTLFSTIFKVRPPQLRSWNEIGGGAPGPATELEEPGEAELDPLPEPQLAITLEAVTDVLSKTQAFDSLPSKDAVSSHGGGRNDPRKIGPPGPGNPDGMSPKWERWQVRFDTTTIAGYAKQLDSLGIELGVVGGGQSQVDYVTRVADAKPARRRGPGESRIYFSAQDRRLRAFDMRLLAKAGVATTGRVVLQFYPEKLISQMEQVERAAAESQGIEEIRHTVFRVLPIGSEPPVEVVSIR